MEKRKVDDNWFLYVLLGKLKKFGYENSKLVAKKVNKKEKEVFGYIINKDFFIALVRENHLILSMDKDDLKLLEIVCSTVSHKPIKKKNPLMGVIVYEWEP